MDFIGTRQIPEGRPHSIEPIEAFFHSLFPFTFIIYLPYIRTLMSTAFLLPCCIGGRDLLMLSDNDSVFPFLLIFTAYDVIHV